MRHAALGLSLVVAVSVGTGGVPSAAPVSSPPPAVSMTLPWTTFSAMIPDVEAAEIERCSAKADDDLAVMTALKGEQRYRYFFRIATGGLLWVVWLTPDTLLPDLIGVGRVDLVTEGARDRIPPIRWRKFILGVDDRKSPCAHLDEADIGI